MQIKFTSICFVLLISLLFSFLFFLIKENEKTRPETNKVESLIQYHDLTHKFLLLTQNRDWTIIPTSSSWSQN